MDVAARRHFPMVMAARGLRRSSSLPAAHVPLAPFVSDHSIPPASEIEAWQLADFISSKQNLAIITGAGISTASGIPDYRGPQGSYRLGHVPIKHADFISSDMTRKRYWMRSMFGWPRLSAAQPNPAHHALALFERNSFLSGIVTQNVDGLHQQAGCTNVIDLHGRIDDVICLQCKSQYHRSTIQTRLSAANPKVAEQIDSHSRHQMRADGDLDVEVADYSLLRVPCCVACGGILKPNVVFFGDNVPISRVEAVNSIIDQSDGVLIVGTSLEVFSAYRFVDRAHRRGLELAIVNFGETRAERQKLGQIRFKSEAQCASLLSHVASLLNLQ